MNSAKSQDKSIRLELPVVLALEAALVVALHLAGSAENAVPLQSMVDWLRVSDPAIVLVALARLVALVIGYWLLSTTLLYGVAHHLGLASMSRTLHWVTLPVIRRVVQGVTAVSLTSASIVGPATMSLAPALAQSTEVAQGDATSGQDDDAEDGEELPDAGAYPVDAAGWPDLGADGDFWRPSSVAQNQNGDLDYTVVRHDHFWKIAEDHLRRTVGRDVTEDEICLYWVRVVDANRSTIRSGDPDLIFPAEEVKLPPVFSE